MNDKINMTFKNSNIMKWKRKFKNVTQWNFDFYDFELNVYLYKMHMGVKKKNNSVHVLKMIAKKCFWYYLCSFDTWVNCCIIVRVFFLEGDVTKEIFLLVVKEMLDNRVMCQCDQGKLFAIGLKKEKEPFISIAYW